MKSFREVMAGRGAGGRRKVERRVASVGGGAIWESCFSYALSSFFCSSDGEALAIEKILL